MSLSAVKQFIRRSPLALPLRWLRSWLLVARTYYQTQQLNAQVQQLEQVLTLNAAQHHEAISKLEQALALNTAQHHEAINKQETEHHEAINKLETDLQQTTATLGHQINDVKRILYPSEHPFAWTAPAPCWQQNAESKLGKLADDLSPEQKAQAFYSYFSEMAPGHQQIRQQQYDLYAPTIKADSGLRFLDIGCGDGEFLSYLQTQNIAAVGIDIEPQEVERALAAGLTAVTASAQQFLSATEEQFCGISLLQVIEHLPPPDILPVLQQCVERLCPGGVLLLETINMRHPLAVNGFYTDPTHQKPLSDNYVSFLVQWLGLTGVQIIYNLPEQLPGIPDDDLTRIYSNYTVVAYKN